MPANPEDIKKALGGSQGTAVPSPYPPREIRLASPDEEKGAIPDAPELINLFRRLLVNGNTEVMVSSWHTDVNPHRFGSFVTTIEFVGWVEGGQFRGSLTIPENQLSREQLITVRQLTRDGRKILINRNALDTWEETPIEPYRASGRKPNKLLP